ncbi:MAG: hypothetical protein KGN76_00130 [Acidobacteriota bacterium]|nr:hypothetical protein [Acidobacteriota bacterium]
MLTKLESEPVVTAVSVEPDDPRPGDVVVRPLTGSSFLFGLGVYPCSLQQPCGIYEQAERLGRSLARRFAVDVWREQDGRFIRLQACRQDG